MVHVVALLASLTFSGLPTPDERYNVLLLIADDLGVDKLSFYQEGQNTPSTPTLAALAEHGVFFRNAWSNPLCSPTRASFMTGRHAFRTGVLNSFAPGNAIPRLERTLPEVLAKADYVSCLTGKWHLGINGGHRAPNVAGYNHFEGSIGGGILNYYRWIKTVNGHSNIENQYATSQNVDDAIRWIDEQTPGRWFCCVSFNAPHIPLHSPPPELHTVDLAGLDPKTDPIPFFNATVEAMDTEIGRLLEHLKDQRENTVVIFAGDNGTAAQVTLPPFDPQHAKGTVYEGGVNVPLIVSGPVVVDPGRAETGLVQLVDLFSTIADLAGTVSVTGIDSVSLMPYLRNTRPPIRRNVVYTEVYGDPLPPDNAVLPSARAVRNERYKLVQKIGRRFRRHDYELYDLIDDPFEAHDLLPHIRSDQMRQELSTLMSVINQAPLTPDGHLVLPTENEGTPQSGTSDRMDR